MSTQRNDGGPAFPTSGDPAAKAQAEGMGLHYSPPSGMTLRDYFIAHAPAEPQPWFVPVMPEECPALEYLNTKDLSAAELIEYEYLHEYFQSVKPSELKTEKVRAYAERAYLAHKQQKAWVAEQAKQRCTQWPAAWADTQIAERNKA